MNLFELFVIAIGVSMDAFAVAICKGLSLKKVTLRNAGIVGLYFGIFQAGMPLIGYFLGIQFRDAITSIDHWVAFILLGIIGFTMIKESRNSSCDVSYNKEDGTDDSLSFKKMSVLAIATSIDALAVGVTFAFLNVSIVPAVSFIGIVTFTLSMFAVWVGSVFGSFFKAKAELTGGLILIIMGVRILLEHTGVLG
ncbi:MAG TPA: manganese efflux pump MntP family protein [Mobilitalea sp.]|nr:manganese efflux pump MntP family protein [Mobilitalea sp.]